VGSPQNEDSTSSGIKPAVRPRSVRINAACLVSINRAEVVWALGANEPEMG
jgi:hypothetical protein